MLTIPNHAAPTPRARSFPIRGPTAMETTPVATAHPTITACFQRGSFSKSVQTAAIVLRIAASICISLNSSDQSLFVDRGVDTELPPQFPSGRGAYMSLKKAVCTLVITISSILVNFIGPEGPLIPKIVRFSRLIVLTSRFELAPAISRLRFPKASKVYETIVPGSFCSITAKIHVSASSLCLSSVQPALVNIIALVCHASSVVPSRLFRCGLLSRS